MAKIVLSADAPDKLNSVSLANSVLDEFPTETTDPVTLGNAVAHPWLDVEYNVGESKVRYRETNVDPTKDPLSASNPNSLLPFDEAAVEAAAQEAQAAAVVPVAIEAGKDQDKAVTEGGVAETVAAVDHPDDAPVVRNDATPEQTSQGAPVVPPVDLHTTKDKGKS